MSPRLVLLGRQGSGKGTQCAVLAEAYGIEHLSTGDLLRIAVAEGSELGRKAAPLLEAGELVSDDVMIAVVADHLAHVGAVGWVLDGFPRTARQATALKELTADRPLDVVINLDVPKDVAIERLTGRGRDDDVDNDVIMRRFENYEREIDRLLEWYAGRRLLETVDGLGARAEVSSRLIEVIDRRLAARAGGNLDNR